jgi:DNA-binding NarL/FixJ family response regulator
MIRILIVDDHPIMRDGLTGVLEDEPDFAIVGAVGSGEQAVAQAAQTAPDVVLLDLEMPGMDGLETIPALLHAAPGTRILVFTAYDTEERVRAALRAGAVGYLLKGVSVVEIVRAIRVVEAGGMHLQTDMARRLLRDGSAPKSAQGGLSAREREVLSLVARGHANKQIAHALGVTERTVKFHLTSIFNKLGADNRAQAVALAAQQCLL